MDPSFEQRNTVEQRANLFREKYKKILSTSVTPENIQIFFESTLNDLIVLVGDVVSQYRVSNLESSLKQAELEDEALRSMGIPDGQETLEAISARARMIIRLKHLIQAQTHVADAVFIPPKPESRSVEIGSGAGMDQKELIPRLLTLLYILENDLAQDFSEEGIDSPMIQITQGITTDHMMRQHPYFRVLLESLHRAVYICEEEGNASYIFDTKTLRFPIEEIDKLDKESLNNLISARPEIGRRLIQSPAWRERMIGYLTEDFSGDMKNIDASQKKKSDFTAVVDIPRKKEGWESARRLRIIMNVNTPENIKKFAEQFRDEHPEWFELQKTGKSNITEHYHPDLSEKIKEHFLFIPRKKEGWENVHALQKIVHASLPVIEKFAEQFRDEYPEWFELQKAGRYTTEHYHPDLVVIIKEHFNVVEKNEGWESASGLRVIMHANPENIKKFAEQFRDEHPEWFELQRRRQLKTEHYHPNLVAKITEHFLVTPQKKEGWESSSSLRKILNLNLSTIEKFAEQFRDEHSEWFGMQKTYARIAEHYHPDLVAKIKEYFLATPRKKEGWESASSSFQKIVRSNPLTIKKFVEQFRDEHPEWFELQKTGKHTVENYHPHLVAKIKEHFPPK